MSMYDMYQTDPEKERSGILIDFGDYRITIARAGGANELYARVLEEKSRPYRRAMETETLHPEVAKRVMAETYAETVVTKWEVLREGKWKPGIDAPDGGVKTFNKENVVEAFMNLPDLFMTVQRQAMNAAMYRAQRLEDDAGN